MERIRASLSSRDAPPAPVQIYSGGNQERRTAQMQLPPPSPPPSPPPLPSSGLV